MDRPLVLSRSYKLKNFSSHRIFVAPDEPIEVRRQQTMTRLKYRAERANKPVSVVDNMLYVDNKPVYSLLDGPVRNYVQ